MTLEHVIQRTHSSPDLSKDEIRRRIVGKSEVTARINDPQGTFALRTAKNDWDISVLYSAYGARVSLPAVLFLLNRKVFAQFAANLDATSCYPVLSILEQTKRLGERPALYFRYGDDVRISDLDHLSTQGFYTKEAIMSRAALSFLDEAYDRGGIEVLLTYYGAAGALLDGRRGTSISEYAMRDRVYRFTQSLNALSKGVITEESTRQYAQLIAAIIGFNYGVFSKIGGDTAFKN